MTALTENERSILRRKVAEGLAKLSVSVAPEKPVVLPHFNQDYLVGQVVDGLHQLGRSADVTPALMEREERWMTAELRSAGVTFFPYALPPDPYAAALAPRRASDGSTKRASPRSCRKEVILDANGIPDPYARALATMKEEQR